MLSVRAVHLGDRIDLRALEGQRIGPATLALGYGDDGRALLFRFGSVVLFGGRAAERDALLARIAPLVTEPLERAETEDTELQVDAKQSESVSDAAVLVEAADMHHLAVVADVLAKSVALAHYEKEVARVFRTIEPLARRLQQKGSPPARSKQLVQGIGASLLMEQDMVGRVEIDEKPELLWEQPRLDRLWELLVAEYEVRERSRAVGRKLELVARTTQTLLDLLQTRRALRVEVMIVLLIVVEVMFTIYELAWR